MSGWGAGVPPRSGLNARHAAQDSQVQIHIGQDKFDFDSEVDGLRQSVGRLKQMSLTIEEERKLQGNLINQLEDTLERAKLGLRRAQIRLNTAYKQVRSNHMLYLVLFAFALFFGVYILAKMYRIGKSIVG